MSGERTLTVATERALHPRILVFVFFLGVFGLTGHWLFSFQGNLVGFTQALATQLQNDPFLSGLLLGLAVLAGGLVPKPFRWALVATMVVAEALRILIVGVKFSALFAVGAPASALGFVILASLSILARGEQRRLAQLALIHGLTLPFLYISGDMMLGKLATQANSTYDLFYYAADRTLGPPWCFDVVRWGGQYPTFGNLCRLLYNTLSQWMSVAAAVWFLRPRATNPNYLYIATSLICALTGYTLCAGVGPQVIFQDLFPVSPPPIIAPKLLPVPAGYPRNTMPSLHLMWAYSIWFALLPQARPLRWAACFYLCMMPTVAFFGSHFLVDYLPTLALGPLIHTALSPAPDRNALRPWAWLIGALALAGVLTCPWLVLGYPIWSVFPATLQLFALSVLAGTVFVNWKIHRSARQRYSS